MIALRHLRLIAICIGIINTAACYTAWQHFGWQGLRSRPLALVSGLLAIVVITLCILLSVESQRKLEKYRSRIWEICKPSNQSPPKSTTLAKICVLCATLAFLSITATFLSILNNESDSDPAAFLRFAQQVKLDGGPLSLITGLYTGEYIQANQHPFYIALLSIAPTLTFGKTLSFIAALMTYLIVSIHLIRTRGWQMAAIATTLLSTNYAFTYFGGLATCESWLTLWFTLCWILLDRAVLQGRLASSRKHWFAAGLLMGLVYLTKGTGTLLLAGLCLAGLSTYYWKDDNNTNSTQPARIQRVRSAVATLLIILTGWVITAHPLLIRNTLVYQSPTFNVNTYFLYMDEFPDEPAIQAKLAASHSLPEVIQTYWEKHTFEELLKREVHGIGWESFVFIRSFGPSPIDDSRVLFAIPLLIFLSLMILHLPVGLKVFVGSLIVMSMLILAWYIPIAVGQRFTAPMLPMLLCYAAAGLNHAIENSNKVSSRLVCIAGISWATLWTVWTVVLL